MDKIPDEVLAQIPEHLRDRVRECKRCHKIFVPLDRDRDRCVPCVRQDRADLNLIRMAYGKTYEQE